MRFFVIGNGTSLNKVNFSKLKGEKTIACNRINLIYKNTDWRPTYYVKVDFTPGEDYLGQIQCHIDNKEKCLLWSAFGFGVHPSNGNHEYIKEFVRNSVNIEWIDDCKCSMNGKASWHFPKICSGMNSVISMVQLAVREGATEIYLLGCDGHFEPGKDHFDEEYYDHQVDKDYVRRNTDVVYRAHMFLHETCPVPVYNCSKNSEYKMWPYRNLKDVLNAKAK